jgi:hypothetical protein
MYYGTMGASDRPPPLASQLVQPLDVKLDPQDSVHLHTKQLESNNFFTTPPAEKKKIIRAYCGILINGLRFQMPSGTCNFRSEHGKAEDREEKLGSKPVPVSKRCKSQQTHMQVAKRSKTSKAELAARFSCSEGALPLNHVSRLPWQSANCFCQLLRLSSLLSCSTLDGKEEQ